MPRVGLFDAVGIRIHQSAYVLERTNKDRIPLCFNIIKLRNFFVRYVTQWRSRSTAVHRTYRILNPGIMMMYRRRRPCHDSEPDGVCDSEKCV